jgi:hypothetical protein
MRKLISVLAIMALATMFMAGCGGGDKTPAMFQGAPDWVMKGSGAFGGDRGKVFYGVGSASGIRNFSLLRTTADNRARNEIAKTFEFYTASLMKDYSASTMAGDPNVTSEEQHVEQAIKTVTSQTLSGVEIVDHWQDPNTGEFFSLARMDLEAFKDAFQKQQQLSERVRDYVRQNADRLHDQLDAEITRTQQ